MKQWGLPLSTVSLYNHDDDNDTNYSIQFSHLSDWQKQKSQLQASTERTIYNIIKRRQWNTVTQEEGSNVQNKNY